MKGHNHSYVSDDVSIFSNWEFTLCRNCHYSYPYSQ